jgi:2,3-bisphosphoglycerate-independent phosphoglycerate mutase
LTDEVVHGTDIKAKVGGIEEFDRDLVGPLMEGLAKQGPYRFLVVCDHGEGAQGQAFYAFGNGGGENGSVAGRRFTESEAAAANLPARDATKFVAKFFSKV